MGTVWCHTERERETRECVEAARQSRATAPRCCKEESSENSGVGRDEHTRAREGRGSSQRRLALDGNNGAARRKPGAPLRRHARATQHGRASS